LCSTYALSCVIGTLQNRDDDDDDKQRISAAIQRFNAVLLHDGFLSSDHPR